MPRLITTDSELRAHIPNVISAVNGETPLIQRIALQLDRSERWVANTFIGSDILDRLCDNDPALAAIRPVIERMVVCDALFHAIPSLDVILTPNGFGVINTSNIAPASQQRSAALMTSMASDRDDCITELLPKLPAIDGWADSEPGRWFAETLLLDLRELDALQDEAHATTRWERYLDIRPRFILAQDLVAESHISTELLAALCREQVDGSLSGARARIAASIRSVLLSPKSPKSSRRLTDIVNTIRLSPDQFPEWHSSATAQLFSPPIFQNSKSASGYFF
ncbi:MAG: hypothetical protein HDR49_00255 [Bacteroides sp.]|nr:hypothetical protein [Bacteroides sp.]